MKTTINKDELKKFTAIADQWWDPSGKFKPLHQINPIRLEYLISTINSKFKTPKSVQILDIGCGGGLVSIPLAKLGYTVLGVDAGLENIKTAEAQALKVKSKATFLHTSIEELAKQKKKFDIVLALEIIEHVEDVKLFLKSCEDVLAKNGILIVSTINRNLKSFLTAKLGAEYILRWLPIGTHDWDKFLKPEEIIEMSSLQKLNTCGLVYNPLSQKWKLSEEDLSVNYFVSFTK